MSSDKDRANEPKIPVLVSHLYVGKPGYKTFGCDEVLFFINTSLIYLSIGIVFSIPLRSV